MTNIVPFNIFLKIAFVREISPPKRLGSFGCFKHERVNA